MRKGRQPPNRLDAMRLQKKRCSITSLHQAKEQVKTYDINDNLRIFSGGGDPLRYTIKLLSRHTYDNIITFGSWYILLIGNSVVKNPSKTHEYDFVQVTFKTIFTTLSAPVS